MDVFSPSPGAQTPRPSPPHRHMGQAPAPRVPHHPRPRSEPPGFGGAAPAPRAPQPPEAPVLLQQPLAQHGGQMRGSPVPPRSSGAAGRAPGRTSTGEGRTPRAFTCSCQQECATRDPPEPPQRWGRGEKSDLRTVRPNAGTRVTLGGERAARCCPPTFQPACARVGRARRTGKEEENIIKIIKNKIRK